MNPADDIRVSFEFFPPATPAGAETLASCLGELARLRPDFVSVTYGAGGTSRDRTVEAIDLLRNGSDVEVAGHITCVAASTDEVQRTIDTYRDQGVRRLVALRGDVPAEQIAAGPQGYRDAAELVAALRARPDGADFDISVAAYPEIHPKATSAAADMDNLKRKLDAGADRAITQFFFETDAFLRFRDEADRAGITAPIVPGIMPVLNFAKISNFSARCGTRIPDWMAELLGDLDDAPEVQPLVAANMAAEQCRRLVEHGIRDFHFYTMNRPALSVATCRMLGVRPQPAVVAS